MSEAKDLLYTVPLYCFQAYLEREDWTLVNENDHWLVFEDNDDVELAIPKNSHASDYPMYIDHVIKTLTFVTNKTPDSVANDILRHDRDIFDTRFTESVDLTSISLRSAFKIIAGLRQLFICATDSEKRESKPFYHRTGTNPGRVFDGVRFGHTFAGSFGYSVESPVNTQTDMFESPLQRRVMERIMRGLATTANAVELQDEQPLVDGYETGFSANMCDAILGMTSDYDETIEYSIRWSKKRPASADVQPIQSVSIQRDHFEILEMASTRLKEVQPEFVTVEGHIVSLSSPTDPQSDDHVDRRATVVWYLEEQQSRRVAVALSKKDYLDAIEAHKQGRLVSVKGHILGTKRQLTEPRDFTII